MPSLTQYSWNCLDSNSPPLSVCRVMIFRSDCRSTCALNSNKLAKASLLCFKMYVQQKQRQSFMKFTKYLLLLSEGVRLHMSEWISCNGDVDLQWLRFGKLALWCFANMQGSQTHLSGANQLLQYVQHMSQPQLLSTLQAEICVMMRRSP